MAKKIEEREAEHGQKMIEVRVRFWTNDIASEKGKIVPKNAWASGVVRTEGNKAHGITPSPPEAFNSIMELTGTIERVLIESGITLHPSRKMKKYWG
jgi:hypothetical protein